LRVRLFLCSILYLTATTLDRTACAVSISSTASKSLVSERGESELVDTAVYIFLHHIVTS
jgi:hypothetical protein